MTKENITSKENLHDHSLPKSAVFHSPSEKPLVKRRLLVLWEGFRLNVWLFAKWYSLLLGLCCSTVFCYQVMVVSTKVAESAIETVGNTAAQYVGASVGKYTVSKVLGPQHDIFNLFGEKSASLAVGVMHASMAVLF
jgi:hypothetical protein